MDLQSILADGEFLHRDGDDLAGMSRATLAAPLARVNGDRTGANVFTTSTTYADIHATKFTLTFTVPASGAVSYRIFCRFRCDTDSALAFRVVDNSAAVQGAAFTYGAYHSAGGDLQYAGMLALGISGLTPDASVTWRPQLASAFAAGTVGVNWGANDPITVEVVAA